TGPEARIVGRRGRAERRRPTHRRTRAADRLNPSPRPQPSSEGILMITRRDLLKTTLNGAALVSLAPTVPNFLARTARAAESRRDGRVLVVLQLDGGNDAINTLVPFRDEGYAMHRSTLRIETKSLIKVNDEVGLHPALRELGRVLERKELALLPGVGYP